MAKIRESQQPSSDAQSALTPYTEVPIHIHRQGAVLTTALLQQCPRSNCHVYVGHPQPLLAAAASMTAEPAASMRDLRCDRPNRQASIYKCRAGRARKIPERQAGHVADLDRHVRAPEQNTVAPRPSLTLFDSDGELNLPRSISRAAAIGRDNGPWQPAKKTMRLVCTPMTAYIRLSLVSYAPPLENSSNENRYLLLCCFLFIYFLSY